MREPRPRGRDVEHETDTVEAQEPRSRRPSASRERNRDRDLDRDQERDRDRDQDRGRDREPIAKQDDDREPTIDRPETPKAETPRAEAQTPSSPPPPARSGRGRRTKAADIPGFRPGPVDADEDGAAAAREAMMDAAAEGEATIPDELFPEITLAELPDSIRKAATDMGWDSLLPVQAKAIPYILNGRDLMCQSRTGSGKTGAFLMPILAGIDVSEASCQALIMVPTRELAQQVRAEAEKLAGTSGIRTVAVHGGVAYGPQLEALKEGAHLVVGTPGRILDHLMRGAYKLDRLRFVVFDEADRMLSMGFYPDMVALKQHLPRKRSSHMFSATYPSRVRALALQFLDDPAFLSLSHGVQTVLATEHIHYEIPAMEKERCLVRIIEIENPDSAIIFCNTRVNTKFVMTVLQRFGYNADLLSADLTQDQREKVLSRVYAKNLRFLVATDVAARGIDVESLSHVINYDFPDDPENYVHRTGRTGRAGASGIAISLVDVLEVLKLKSVERQFGVTIEARPLPTREDVSNMVAERATAALEARLRSLDRLRVERLQRMIPLARRLSEDEDELAVLAMLIDEFYHAEAHKPPDVPLAPITDSSVPRSTTEREEERPRRSSSRRPPRGRSRR